MAVASSLEQIPVFCQLCDGSSQIQWKCCNCDMLMCTKCKEKVHSKFKNFNNHKIIDIKNVGQHDSENTIAFSDVNCKHHADHQCCLFCKTCKELVCPKCISKTHNGHNLVDEEEYGMKREIIRDKKTTIDKKLSDLTTMKRKISKIRNFEYSKYDKSKRAILAEKMAVEKLVEELLNELDDKWKQVNLDLEGMQNELDKMEEELLYQKTTMDELTITKDFVIFFEETDKIELSLDKNIHINAKYSCMPEFYSGKVNRDNIGTLKIVDIPIEMKNKIEVIGQFISDLEYIHYTKICSDGSLWIGDYVLKIVQLVQINGNNIRVLLMLYIEVSSMAVTPSGELLICGESVLKHVSRTGEIKASQYNVAPLVSTAVHVTSSNKVIIGAKIPGRAYPASGSCIVMMDQKGNPLVKYELDSNKRPLFFSPYRIAMTSEGNICVVDWRESDIENRVVVLSPTGDVISTYSGHSDINNKEPFKPFDIITTNLNNIVVVECNSSAIHILDSEGQFIAYYSTKDLGISFPCSLALSSKGNLYIGCANSPDNETMTFEAIIEILLNQVKSMIYEVEFSGF